MEGMSEHMNGKHVSNAAGGIREMGTEREKNRETNWFSFWCDGGITIAQMRKKGNEVRREINQGPVHLFLFQEENKETITSALSAFQTWQLERKLGKLSASLFSLANRADHLHHHYRRASRTCYAKMRRRHHLLCNIVSLTHFMWRSRQKIII